MTDLNFYFQKCFISFLSFCWSKFGEYTHFLILITVAETGGIKLATMSIAVL